MWKCRTLKEKALLQQDCERRTELFQPFIQDFEQLQREEKQSPVNAKTCGLATKAKPRKEYDARCVGHWIEGHHYRICGRLPKNSASCETFVQQLPLLFLHPIGSRFFSDLVSIERVPAGHVPVSLVGQWGGRAKTNVAALTALGLYEGYVYSSTDPTPPDWIAKDSCYGLEVDLCRRGVNHQYVIEAIPPYANGAMERLNDFRVNVSVKGKKPPNDPTQCNCSWITVFRDGEPFELTFTTRPVAQGEWFQLDYSNAFWRYRMTLPDLKKKPLASNSILLRKMKQYKKETNVL